MALKYKEGDRVQIKSLDWYNENKTIHGDIWFDNSVFVGGQSLYCGCELTIRLVTNDSYYVIENDYYWTDEMIEGLVEEETPKFKIHDKVKTIDGFTGIILNVGYDNNIHCFRYHVSCILNREWYNESQLKLYDSKENEFNLPDGYIFKDENGNVINATKIVLEKKKKEYPKTYEECCKVLGCKADHFFTDFSYNGCDVEISDYEDKIDDLLQNFRKLRYCRDAYWKIAGDEMGLGKSWEPTPDTFQTIYVIRYTKNNGKEGWDKNKIDNTRFRYILSFPTEEMRDAFYKNFKELIEICK